MPYCWLTQLNELFEYGIFIRARRQEKYTYPSYTVTYTINLSEQTMNKTGEYLFDAVGSDLRTNLERITEDDVEDCCGYKTFQRGMDYFNDGLVELLNYNAANDTITATVVGTNEYSVDIFINNNEVQGICSCPVYGVCKHMIAVLLSIACDGISNIKTVNIPLSSEVPVTGLLKQHLKSLSKDELVDLVVKFAPEGFITRIKNKYTNHQEAIVIFNKVEKKIREFFNDPELLYEPSDFEESLISELDKLSGLEHELVGEIGKLILFIMDNVENAFDEGYLYVDSYYGDDYFESEDFCSFVTRYIKQLSFKQKTDYLFRLDGALNSMSYDTFENIALSYGEFFSDKEYPLLKKFVLNSMESVPDSYLSRLYNYLEPGLSVSGKEKVLLRLKSYSDRYVINLAEMFVQQEKYHKAYEIIKEYVHNDTGFAGNRAIELYLELSARLDYDLNEPARVAVTCCPSASMLEKIKEIAGGSTTEYEKILKSENPEELLKYYEKENMLQDAVSLIKESGEIWDTTLFEFFKRNKKSVPSEAEGYFVSRINENLGNAGENYYARVAETLGQVKQINPSLADKLITDIRLNFKRRTKLMAILKRF